MKKNDAPDYKNNPTSVSVTLYDMQGDPVSMSVIKSLTEHAEALARSVKSLAIDVKAL